MAWDSPMLIGQVLLDRHDWRGYDLAKRT